MTRNPQVPEWVFIIMLVLLAWGLRLCCMETVPPGWRDDELVNAYVLSGDVLDGHFPLYFTGASGHEPLYHYLHAGVQILLGHNPLSRHFLSVVFGTLTVILTYAVARRILGTIGAGIAALGLATSFWSLMYSRIALRHVSLPPLALGAFFLLPITTASTQSRYWQLIRWGAIGLLIALSIYTYPAARLLPVLVALFALYLALFHRDRFRHQWRGFATAFLVILILVIPLGVAIHRGSSERSEQGIGADARLSELAKPLRELQAGNPHPVIQNTWKTLGMLHATGDPEWLYNIKGRSLFNLFGAALVWSGVAICLLRWREPQKIFLIMWLGIGLLPAFVSTPEASMSHTILAQPVVYIFPALSLTELHTWVSDKQGQASRHGLGPFARNAGVVISCSLIGTFLATNAVRDLTDYFIVWPRSPMVRILYRADYREAANYLNNHPTLDNVAVGSALLGPWDRLALRVDVERDDISPRLFNPERSLVWAGNDSATTVLIPSWPTPTPPILALLQATRDPSGIIGPGLKKYVFEGLLIGETSPLAHFGNGLRMMQTEWLEPVTPDQKALLLTTWCVSDVWTVPPMPIVANPPPPGVYTGPRLKVFAHLVDAKGTLVDVDDGLWVDPLTLQPGDCFVQMHHFNVPSESNGIRVELGLYDPKTGERWNVVDAREQTLGDRVTIK